MSERERKRRAKAIASQCERDRDTLTFYFFFFSFSLSVVVLLLLLLRLLLLLCDLVFQFIYFFSAYSYFNFSNVYARCTHKHIKFHRVFDILYVLSVTLFCATVDWSVMLWLINPKITFFPGFIRCIEVNESVCALFLSFPFVRFFLSFFICSHSLEASLHVIIYRSSVLVWFSSWAHTIYKQLSQLNEMINKKKCFFFSQIIK